MFACIWAITNICQLKQKEKKKDGIVRSSFANETPYKLAPNGWFKIPFSKVQWIFDLKALIKQVNSCMFVSLLPSIFSETFRSI